VITIVEGPLMTVGEVTFSGNVALSSDALAPHVATKTGEAFYEPKVIQDRENVVIQYQNHGFAGASVDVRTAIVEGSRVNLTFEVAEGAQSIVDHVLIVGNVKTETLVIEREVQFKPGQPLGLEALFETRRRLAALGLFRRVRITEIPHGETNTRDVLIEVEEAPATTVGYGGGVELSQRLKTGENGEATEETEIAPRGFFEIGRRNLGGRNRSVNLYTRLSLRSDIAETGGGTFGFPEYRVVGTYREPRAFLWNADVTVTAAIEQGARSTFNFARKGVNAEVQRRFPSASGPIIQFTPGTAQYVWIGRYSFSTTRTFDERLSEEEQATIDRIFPQVRLSVLSTSIVRDTRDDAVEPTRGFFLSGEGSVAMRALGGEVGYVKTYMQAHAYRRLFQTRRLIFAGRFGLGLADGFPRQVEIVDAEGNVRVGTIEDLPASERFFAGGDTTIRGFALDSVGAENTITPTGFPRGGNGLVLMNAELRVPIWGDVSGAVFVDGGNVFERVTQIDFANLRGAVGVGVRYRSPIGPLRLDVGFKLDRRVIGGELESPRAWHFSFGHAF
jgi:outer membrane protein assembly complex protein YaeT